MVCVHGGHRLQNNERAFGAGQRRDRTSAECAGNLVFLRFIVHEVLVLKPEFSPPKEGHMHVRVVTQAGRGLVDEQRLCIGGYLLGKGCEGW